MILEGRKVKEFVLVIQGGNARENTKGPFSQRRVCNGMGKNGFDA